MRLRLPKFNWFDCLLVFIGLVVLAGMMSVRYFYRWPQVYKFSCQIDRTKPNEPCHFIVIGNNFVAPIQVFIAWPAMTDQSLMSVQLKEAKLNATPFVFFMQGKKLIGLYRIEDTDALMGLIARSGFAILPKEQLFFKIICTAELGKDLTCEKVK